MSQERRQGNSGGARLLRRVMRRAVFIVSGLLIILALAYSGLRMALPMMAGYQQDLAAWLGAQWGQPVTFTRLDLGWSGYRPQLVVEGVRLSGGPTISHVALSLAPWRSLIHQRLTLGRVEIDSPRFTLQQDEQGKWHLAGYHAHASPASGAGGVTLAQWQGLMRRLGMVSIRDARVRLQNAAGRTLDVDLDLAAQITEDHWAASGQLQIPGLTQNPTRLRAEGDLGAQRQGRAYLAVDDWQLARAQELLRAFGHGDAREVLGGCRAVPAGAACYRSAPQVNAGRLTGALWLDWNRAGLNGIQSRVDVTNLAVTRPAHDQVAAAHSGIRHLRGRLSWRKQSSGWRLDVDRLHVVTTDDAIWPTQSVHVIQDGNRTAFAAGYADINQLAVWLSTAPLPQSYLNLLGTSAPRGQARDIRLQFDGDRLNAGYLRLENFGNAAGKRLWPVVGKANGIGGINMTLYKQPAGWLASLDQRHLVLAVPGLLREPVTIDHIAGDIYWQDRPSPVIYTHHLVLDNPDLHSTGRFLYRGASIDGRLQPLLQIDMDFGDVPIKRVPAYLPRNVLGKPVLKWLDRALVGQGRADHGQFMFDGNPRRFPFRQGEGLFSVDFDFDHLTLPYLSKWPALTGASGHIRFLNQGFAARIADGEVGGVSVAGSHVAINDFDHAKLGISVATRDKLSDYLTLLGRTPLIAPSTFADIATSGQANLDLNVAVDLDRHDGKQKSGTPKAVARGQLTFDGNQLRIKRTPIKFDGLSGKLAFVNSDINAERLDARFDGAPARIVVKTPKAGNSTLVRTQLRLDPLFALRGTPSTPAGQWLKQVSGKAMTDVQVRIPHQGNLVKVSASSGLIGLKSALPAPLEKSGDTPWPTEVDFGLRHGMVQDLRWRTQGQEAPRIDLNYNADGKGRPRLDLNLKAAGLNWDDWQSIVKQAATAGSASERQRWPAMTLHLSLTHLRLLGRDFRNTTIKASPTDRGFRLDTDGKDLAGRLTVSPATSSMPLRLQGHLKRLYLNTAAGSGGSKQPDRWDLNAMPALDLTIDDLRAGKTRFGSLSFKAQPTGSSQSPGWLVAPLVWQPTKTLRIDGRASVRGQGGKQRSEMDLTANGQHVGAVLQQLFGATPMKNGQVKSARAQLQWPGALSAFSLRSASGHGRFVLEKGRILDVDTGAGRLAGLLSLGALTRRLRLDFRDVVDDGLAFDTLAGKWQLSNGRLSMQPLELKNPSLAAIATGSSDLHKQTLDYRVKVYADVGMLLPIIGTVAGGPIVGGAILALQQVLKKVDKNPSPTLTYRVTGTFDKPVVKRGKEANGG